jgi:hypothetical protein
MFVYIVTSKTTERDAAGIILSAQTRFWGAFSSESVADAMAAKWGGEVHAAYLDQEATGSVLHLWINPGFASQ